jgi:hypothetical protein
MQPRRARVPWAALIPGLLLVVVPKCPLCLAAYLTVVGISAGAAAPLAGAIHPLIPLVGALGLALFVVQAARAICARHRRARAGERIGTLPSV